MHGAWPSTRSDSTSLCRPCAWVPSIREGVLQGACVELNKLAKPDRRGAPFPVEDIVGSSIQGAARKAQPARRTCSRCCSICSTKGTICVHPTPLSLAVSRPFTHSAAGPDAATPLPAAHTTPSTKVRISSRLLSTSW